jgi:hypothetical protein
MLDREENTSKAVGKEDPHSSEAGGHRARYCIRDIREPDQEPLVRFVNITGMAVNSLEKTESFVV